jgi:nicotinamidase-related amidase
VARGLLIIDIQRDYLPGGAYPLVAPDAAAATTRRLLNAFRAAGEPVIPLADGYASVIDADSLLSEPSG